MVYRSKEIRNLIAIFLKLCFYEWWSSWDVNHCVVILRPKTDPKWKNIANKLTLCPTHEGMVEIASVFDFFKKHNTTSTVDPECKKSGNFTTNGPPRRSRFCPFDFGTKHKKIIYTQACRTFFWCEKSCFRRMRPSQLVHFWSGCGGGGSSPFSCQNLGYGNFCAAGADFFFLTSIVL